ncbi:MAG: chemotaxis protein CheX [Planctomycetes bacterium]|nr:chemotaxis protein CheX [Planctomycetota bacterium]
MNQLDADRLAKLAIQTLERTAFVLAESISAEEAANMPQPTRYSRIAYTGPSCGEVFLAASEGFIRELASSILGVEPDEIDLETQGPDALKELANIVAGSVTLELGGAECRLSLGLPELADSSDMPSVADQGQQCFLESEGELLKVMWIPDTQIVPTVA